MDPNDSSSTNLFSEKDRALFFAVTQRLWDLINKDTRRTTQEQSQEGELQQYLDGKDAEREFIQARDRLQIYGGALAIWNEVDRELVHVQDRKDYPSKYRSSLEACSCDLTERIFRNGNWEVNPFDEVVNFMFIRSRGREHSEALPEFLEEFRLAPEHSRMSQVERKYRCIFCSDGEVGAGTLLLRLTMAYMMASGLCGNDIDSFLSSTFVRSEDGYEKLTFDSCASSPAEKCRDDGMMASCHSLREITCKQFPTVDVAKPDSTGKGRKDNLEKIKSKYDEIDRAIYPPGGHTIFREMELHGLIERDPGATGVMVEITERYVNLCRFIFGQTNDRIRQDAKAKDMAVKWRHRKPGDKPEDPGEVCLWFDRSDEKETLSKLSTYHSLNRDRECLRRYTEREFSEDTKAITLDAFEEQMRFICKVLLLSIDVEAFGATPEPRTNMKRVLGTIDEVVRFPTYPYFIWRLNGVESSETKTRLGGTSAMAHIALQLGLTQTGATYKEIGYLLAGIRNVYEDPEGNRQVISIHSDETQPFKELVTNIRALFLPLMSPLMDRIYYGEILKDSEWKDVVFQLSHSINNDMMQLRTRIAWAHHKTKNIPGGPAEELRLASESAQNASDLMDLLVGYRRLFREEGLTKVELEKQKEERNAFLSNKTERLNVRDLVRETLQTLAGTTKLLRLNVENHGNAIRSLIEENLDTYTSNCDDFALSYWRAPVRLIILDLFKNAVRHTKPNSPELRIEGRLLDDGWFSLSLANNKRMTQEEWNYCENGIEARGFSASIKVGMKVVRWWAAVLGWKIHFENPSTHQEDWTRCSIKIPPGGAIS